MLKETTHDTVIIFSPCLQGQEITSCAFALNGLHSSLLQWYDRIWLDVVRNWQNRSVCPGGYDMMNEDTDNTNLELRPSPSHYSHPQISQADAKNQDNVPTNTNELVTHRPANHIDLNITGYTEKGHDVLKFVLWNKRWNMNGDVKKYGIKWGEIWEFTNLGSDLAIEMMLISTGHYVPWWSRLAIPNREDWLKCSCGCGYSKCIQLQIPMTCLFVCCWISKPLG